MALDSEIRLRLLKLLEDQPEMTQRQMNKKMGVSLGKVNYCLTALIEKGMIRVERFKKHKKKSAYIYRLTPKGFEELASLTLSFLKLRIQEYDQVRLEIKILSDQIDKIDPNLWDDPELLKALNNIN
ncbi:MAG: MarR family EPS-associated transcriptional regulator [Proteobacteria bacterium]|nr:MarR family EPS-associated transcriptional regulator [Pseudomonadota bacterium]MBU1582713.1 MarR family EPS-associated transcriptional regulator [Pseudomonadota bacterium]MBU2454078.1 MarR family EPS-associated transcriptional regulator [Pseudomonadota bacterium]